MNSTGGQPGLAGFALVWAGQVVSVLATQMTAFALVIWVYQRTGSVTALGLQEAFYITPFLLMTPLAGVLVDRHSRKLMMMVSDLGAGAATVGVLALQAAGALEVWHLYVAAAVTGACACFQWPAFSASISLMVPEEHLGRANGMMSLVESGPGVLAPLLAGALLPVISLTGILLIDVVTFVLAVGALAVVRVPQPAKTEGEQKDEGKLRDQLLFGLRYILARPGLLAIQLVFLFGNLASAMGFTVLAPMVLTRTGQNETTLGLVLGIGAAGGVAGGIVMSAWGGFKRRTVGVMGGFALDGLATLVGLGLGRGPGAWMAGMFARQAATPLVDSSNQALWQTKVPPELQGRVFSTRMLIAWITFPLAPLIAGPLADYVLEPGMRAEGSLAGTFGWLVGTGPGAGMALLLAATGVMMMAAGAVGWMTPVVRDVERA
jgi:MFS family permease